MEMDPQERESEIGEESPVSHNDEELSEGDVDRDHDDADSCDELRRHGSILADHGDVLAKLKMQVRDIKVGEDFENARHLNFPAMTAVAAAAARDGGVGLTMTGLGGGGGGGGGVGSIGVGSMGGVGGGGGGIGGFQLPVSFPFPHPAAFLPPLAPQPAAPSSGSSHSSEGSASSQHTWSFEEQFKQVRQLYEINDDPKRKEFLDDLFSFMQKRGTPINRLPIMAKSVLDLYELYNLVIARGGLVDVINKKLWQEIIKGLHLPSSITSAAFTLRTQYMKYLYPYECEKRRLSTPAELQAAIDGNRREGRRSSYGQYDSIQRSPNPAQMSPLTLVSQQQQHLAARMNSVMGAGMQGMGLHNGSVHHPSHPQPLGQQLNGGPLPGLAPSEFEARMLEYVKLLNKEMRSSAATTPPRSISGSGGGGMGGGGGGGGLGGGGIGLGGDCSPPSATSPLNPLEMSRMTLWNLYNNNQPQVVEPQKEALNLSDPQPLPIIKREPETRDSPPPAKKFLKDDEVKQHMTASTNIKINSRGDSRTGDNSLVVSMELNGVTYQGVLFAQTQSRTAIAS